MRKIILLFSVVAWSTCLLAQSKPVSITVTSPTWKNMYAWIWNCSKQYSERFVPLTHLNDSTWTLLLDIDADAYKKAGLLFVDTDSWNTDLQKTTDMSLKSGCYVIPEAPKQRQIVKRPNGLVCRELIFECKKEVCQ